MADLLRYDDLSAKERNLMLNLVDVVIANCRNKETFDTLHGSRQPFAIPNPCACWPKISLILTSRIDRQIVVGPIPK